MAIVTNKIKKQIMNDLLVDTIDSSSTSSYYIGVGRSEDWNDSDIPPATYNSGVEERDFRNALQSVIKVNNASFVIPRYNWSSGAIYSAFDDNTVGYPAQPYYVINDNNQVYMCLQQARSSAGVSIASSVQPTGNTTGTPFETADGYRWKFLYSIGPLDATKYVSANYLPVKFIASVDSDSPAADVEQLAAQNNAIIGQITNFVVDSGGAGYTSTPTIVIEGNGSGTKGVATISGGQVTRVQIVDSSGTFAFGSGYDYARVYTTGGGSPTKPAAIRPVVTKSVAINGLGADPRDELRSTAIMFNAVPDGIVNGDWIVDNDFRQVGLIKDPYWYDSSDLFGDASGYALKALKTSTNPTNLAVDDIITGTTSGNKAIIDQLDSDTIWYHQTKETGFLNFDSGETVTNSGGQTATLNAAFAPFVNPEVDAHTGSVLYIDNGIAQLRSADNAEDIKLVIQI